MILKNKYIVILLFLLFAGSLQAQVSEYEYKAAFMERFTRFIEWPGLGESEVFKIAVIGESPFNSSLDELFNGTIIKNKKVEIW